MSSSQDVISQAAPSKLPVIIKVIALICTIVGVVGMWLIIQQIGVTPLSIVCIAVIIILAALCLFSAQSSGKSSVNVSSKQTAFGHSNDNITANSALIGDKNHQNPLFKPLALLTLADKQQLLETTVNPQQLIETKQTFEQCCAWQFSEPESFDCLDLYSADLRDDLCGETGKLTALNVLTGKAKLKSEVDKQNINKAWQQLLISNSSNSGNGERAVECQYDVLDAQGKTHRIVETWLLGQGERCLWYRAIGLVSAQGAKVAAAAGAKTSGQMTIHKDKMDALVRFADGIAHDYNNLFGIVNGYTELMTGILDDPKKVNSYIEQIQSASTRAAALSDQILALSRRRKAGMELVDFEQIMIEPLFIFKKNLPDTVKFDWVLGKSHHQIKLDSSKLEEVLFAIGENAITAMDAKGSLRIVSEVTTLPPQKAASLALSPGDYLCFSVIDNGCGMDNEQLNLAIEPYYSTSGGCGFGLSSVYGFMKNCDGALGIDSSLGQGTRVSLYFPLINEEA